MQNTDAEVYTGHPLLCELYRDNTSTYSLVDCSQEGWTDLVDTGSLFPTPLLLTHLEDVEKKDAAKAARALLQGPGNRGEGTRISKDLARLIENKVKIRDLTFKSKDMNIKLWQQVGERLGMRLDLNCIKEINNRLGHDVDRAIGVVTALAAGGWTEPTVRQIAVLAGTDTKTGVPWEVLGYAEKGDWDSVRSLMPVLDPIPAIAYIGKRCLTSLVLCRDSLISDTDLSRYVGEHHPLRPERRAYFRAKRRGGKPETAAQSRGSGGLSRQTRARRRGNFPPSRHPEHSDGRLIDSCIGLSG